MKDVFISYRHEDSKSYAGRIFDRLKGRFGSEHVFMDITAIRAGSDFVDAIDNALGRCDAFIVVIGKQWLSIADEHGSRRLDDPGDFVRLEVAAALARRMRIVPVLVDDARMPSDDALPKVLKKLARIQALDLSDRRWDFDMEQLVGALIRPTGEPHTPPPPKPTGYTGPQPRSYASAAATMSVLTAVGFGAFMIVILTVGGPQPIGEASADVLPYALAVGLTSGLISGCFLRGDMITVRSTGRDEFDARINAAMSEFGFLPVTASADFMSFRPSLRAGIGLGRISVTVGEGTVTIVGPARFVHRLKARFG